MYEDRCKCETLRWFGFKAVSMLKKIWKKIDIWEIKPFVLKWYPSTRGCVKSDINSSTPLQQMPPLMVRKAAWRR